MTEHDGDAPTSPQPRITLADRTAIVTGSASGIGEAVARHLAGLGARVVIADLDADGAERVADDIRGEGGEALAMAVDVGDPPQIERMVAETIRAFGRVDILHNNAVAGSPLDVDVLHMDLEAWELAMRVNLRGYMLGCKAVLPDMLSRSKGVIVNTSSNSGLSGELTRTAYGVSKAGINGLTLHVATQYGRFGIRCNAVSPGLVMTPKMASADALPEQIREIYQLSHLNPRFTRPEDVANLVGFLFSDAGEMINGQIISIDGGMLAHTPSYAHFVAMEGGSGEEREQG